MSVGEEKMKCEETPAYIDFSHLPRGSTLEDVIAVGGNESLRRSRAADDGRGKRGPCQSATFPAKLYEILAQPELDDIIAWLPHGRSWKIIDQVRFVNLVMPHFFSQSKHASFMRQVNGWGFIRITKGRDQNSYYNELFLRSKRHLVKFIQRTAAPKRAEHEAEPDFETYPPLPPSPPKPCPPSLRHRLDVESATADQDPAEAAAHAVRAAASMPSDAASASAAHHCMLAPAPPRGGAQKRAHPRVAAAAAAAAASSGVGPASPESSPVAGQQHQHQQQQHPHHPHHHHHHHPPLHGQETAVHHHNHQHPPPQHLQDAGHKFTDLLSHKFTDSLAHKYADPQYLPSSSSAVQQHATDGGGGSPPTAWMAIEPEQACQVKQVMAHAHVLEASVVSQGSGQYQYHPAHVQEGQHWQTPSSGGPPHHHQGIPHTIQGYPHTHPSHAGVPPHHPAATGDHHHHGQKVSYVHAHPSAVGSAMPTPMDGGLHKLDGGMITHPQAHPGGLVGMPPSAYFAHGKGPLAAVDGMNEVDMGSASEDDKSLSSCEIDMANLTAEAMEGFPAVLDDIW